MNKILKYGIQNKITDGNNYILNKSLEKEYKEDRIITMVAKEVTDFVMKTINKKSKRK